MISLFVRRPVLALVLSLLLMLLGAMAFTRLGVRETPDTSQPVVTVSTAWPGADPAIVESDVTEILERELNGIEGVRTISSTSADQVSTITVEFDLERDLEAAANDVRSRVSRARRNLPEDVEEPVVEKADSGSQPVMFLRVESELHDLLQLTEIADTLVRERLENVPGVSGVDLYGAKRFAMRVELDPGAMAARGLTLGDVENALREGNAELPAGRVEGDAVQLALRFDAGLRSVEDFEALLLRPDLRLGEVARVRLGAENERTSARAEGKPSLSVAILPQAQANILDISDEVQRRVPLIQADLPEGVQLDLVYDRGNPVRRSIHDVELTLFVAVALVGLVIFAFLRDFRSTLVPVLAIPVSIVGTFLFLWVAGFTINVFTLFGLVLAIGLVVDDAIVVLENAVRRLEAGADPQTAAREGTEQVAFAVLATTASLIAVFLPVIFTGGTTGRLFLEFGTTVAVAVALSAVVALTLTPVLCAAILKARAHEQAEDDGGLLGRLVGGAMRRPLLVALAVPLAVAGAVWGNKSLPQEFFPLEDRDIFFVRAQAVEGTSFAWMDARVAEVEGPMAEQVPERRVLMSRVATAPGNVVAPTNSAIFVMPLIPASERERSQQEIVAALKPFLGSITAFRTIPIQFPTVGRSFSSPLQLVILHPDFDELAAALPGFVKKMRELPGLASVNEDLRLDRPELRVTVDREKARELGVAPRQVARALQVLSSGVPLSTFKRGVRQYDVVVSLPADARSTPERLAGVQVRAQNGAMVPLSRLLRFEEKSGPASRFHYDRSPSATISAIPDGISLGEAIGRAQELAEKELPAGFRTALAGESRDFSDSRGSLGGLFALATALVYLLLAAQFDSFRAPLAILAAVPAALAGAFGGLALMGMSSSFFSQVGLILLVGLVAKNGILIVEVARHLHEEGMDRWAAAELAARRRLRPILMTSVATIGGAIPIAVGFSGTSRAPLGVTVVAGLLLSTLLTVLVTPVAWAWLEGLGRPRASAAAGTGLALAALAFAPEARAQSLAEVLDTADAQNLSLVQARAAQVAVEAGVHQARAALLPQVAAGGTAWYGFDPRFGLTDPRLLLSAQVRADVALLDAASVAAWRAAQEGAAASAAGVEQSRQEVLRSAALAWIALQEAGATLSAAEADRQLAERLRDEAARRVKVGASAPIELTRAELALRRAEAALLAAGTAQEAARLGLAEVLGLPLDTTFELPPPVELALPSGDGLAPSVEAARLAESASMLDLRAARWASAPSLDGYGFVAEARPWGMYWQVGATVTVPLLSGGARAAEVRAGQAQVSAATASRMEVERGLEAEILLARRTLDDARSALEVARAAKALAEEELSQAEDRWRAGAGPQLDVVRAQESLAQARAAEVRALAAANRAVVALAASQGVVQDLR